MATVYDLITARITEKLAQGVVPWQRPWNNAAGIPCNLLSQKRMMTLTGMAVSSRCAMPTVIPG